MTKLSTDAPTCGRGAALGMLMNARWLDFGLYMAKYDDAYISKLWNALEAGVELPQDWNVREAQDAMDTVGLPEGVYLSNMGPMELCALMAAHRHLVSLCVAALRAGHECPTGPAPRHISMDAALLENWWDGQQETLMWAAQNRCTAHDREWLDSQG